MVGGASKQWPRGNHGNPDTAHQPGTCHTKKHSGKPSYLPSPFLPTERERLGGGVNPAGYTSQLQSRLAVAGKVAIPEFC